MMPTVSTRRSRRALTLIELVVTVAVAAMAVSLAAPALSTSREQARRQQCAINQKKIIKAYALWAQDHGGFWPPRCAPDDGCQEYNNVWILVDGPAGPSTVPKQAGTAYYDGPRNTGSGLVGVPIDEGAVDDYPLNPYVVPGWAFGDPLEVTHCPSDDQTLEATSTMDTSDLAKRGFVVGDIGSAYEFFGTSYMTNAEGGLPWKGHGDWAGSVVTLLNKMQGPNFNPDLIYRPGAYVAGLEVAAWYPAWNQFIAALTGDNLGGPVIGAKWHEDQLAGAGKWLNANAYHADGHVTFARRQNMEVIGQIIPLPSAQCFITPEWSMFPLKIPAQLMTPDRLAICEDSP